RRGRRSESTPPKRSMAMCGSVNASQTTARAVALFETARVCQPIATYQTPSPSSEIVLAVQSSRKSRLAKGARNRLISLLRQEFAETNIRWSRRADGCAKIYVGGSNTRMPLPKNGIALSLATPGGEHCVNLLSHDTPTPHSGYPFWGIARIAHLLAPVNRPNGLLLHRHAILRSGSS